MEASQEKMGVKLHLWQLGSYFGTVKMAQSKQSVLSEKEKILNPKNQQVI